MKVTTRYMNISFLLLLTGLFLAGCGGQNDENAGGKSYRIDRVFRRGPVNFRVAVSSGEITIADNIELLLQVESEQGYTAQLPTFGEKLENFGIVDYRTLEPELEDDGAVVKSRTYLLEPFLSGEYTIPPMTVDFWSDQDTTVHHLSSDTIRVNVLSLMPGEDDMEDVLDLTIRDIAGPEVMPGEIPWALIATGAVILLGTGGVVIYRRRKSRQGELPSPEAHEIALSRLKRLLERDLTGQKRYVEFTIEVSDILRGYIEDRFGIHAPEMTTEEFLHESGDSALLSPEHKKILESFLTHSDLVKFARLNPAEEDVQRTFDTCRDFINETKIEREVNGEKARTAPA
ncbi:MAG: hypothetical protein R6U43_10205 [Candidatus Krumholzibacteriales bacterium]